MELNEREIKQNLLAEQLGIAPTNLSNYINGKRNFTADFALKLEDTLGIPAIHWVNMQANYDLTKARIKRTERINPARHAAML
jgi:addiction module HigA family antidote